MSKLGLEPELAASGAKAIELAATESFDVMLMDLSMPEIDGFEATAAILALDQDSPAILALTADVQASTRERCMKSGMSGFLSKPFRVEELKSHLAEVYERTVGCSS